MKLGNLAHSSVIITTCTDASIVLCCVASLLFVLLCRSVAQERSLLTGELGMVTVQMLAPAGRLDGFNSTARALESVSNTAGPAQLLWMLKWASVSATGYGGCCFFCAPPLQGGVPLLRASGRSARGASTSEQ